MKIDKTAEISDPHNFIHSILDITHVLTFVWNVPFFIIEYLLREIVYINRSNVSENLMLLRNINQDTLDEFDSFIQMPRADKVAYLRNTVKSVIDHYKWRNKCSTS
jgi:hypothetical protein